MNDSLIKKIIKNLSKFKYSAVFSFAFVLLLTVSAITFIVLRGFSGMEKGWVFSIGADLFCLAVANMLLLSWILGNRSGTIRTKTFIALVTANAIELFLDICAWIVQGVPSLGTLNIIINALYYTCNDFLIYLFWAYSLDFLRPDTKLFRVLDHIINILLVPVFLLDLLNLFIPIYFSVDENGIYSRTEYWIYSQIFLAFVLSVFLLSLFFSKESRMNKLVITSFVTIPLLSIALTQYQFGVTAQYAAMLVSVVLIYCVLFAQNINSIDNTRKELHMASEIQKSALRKNFDVSEEIDIYASMTPAMEVGGDFYDFFMIDDRHLVLIIADVSGKGVSASLFMMSSKIRLNNAAYLNTSPAKILEFVNRHLCENNILDMFVTVWLGILDIETGELISANAGHEDPAIRRKGGKFELIKNRHGFVLGVSDKMRYKDEYIKLEKDDVIYLYTDGVTESENIHHNLFKVERMLDSLNSTASLEPKSICDTVKKDINAFKGKAERSDDITMMCLKYNGCEEARERHDIDADISNMEVLTSLVESFILRHNIPESMINTMNLVVEEIFVNISSYAYEDKGVVNLLLKTDGKSMTVIFRDAGVPYNPLEKPDPDITLSVADRPIGGLGIFMVKKMMDDVVYKNENGYNILTIKKYF